MFYKKYFELFNNFRQNSNMIKNFKRNSWLKENGFYEVETYLVGNSFFKDKNYITREPGYNGIYQDTVINAKRHFNLDRIVDTLNIEENKTYCIIPIIKRIQYLPKEANGDISKSVEIDLNMLEYRLIQYTAWDEEYLSLCDEDGELIREYMTIPIKDDNILNISFVITTATNNIQIHTKYSSDIIEKILYVNIGFMVKNLSESEKD